MDERGGEGKIKEKKRGERRRVNDRREEKKRGTVR